MAQGKASNWARMKVRQPVWLNNRGIEIVVWDKWGRHRKGTLVVSVGGLRWYPYKTKRAAWRGKWDRLSDPERRRRRG